jgi:hypothetical protein
MTNGSVNRTWPLQPDHLKFGRWGNEADAVGSKCDGLSKTGMGFEWLVRDVDVLESERRR